MTGKARKASKDTYSEADYAHQTARLYDNIVEWYVESFWTDLTDQDWIEASLQRIPPSSIVADIGSGPGNYAQYFLARGHKTYCVDISREMIKEVCKRLPSAVAKVGDMRHLPLGDEIIDCVFCAYSINHVTGADIRTVLSEFVRVTRRGGLIILCFKKGKG
jgi:ubiquinone/menaquinone biosynthesis C-methylase UbiE